MSMDEYIRYFYREISFKIYERRRKLGITQKRLAEICGLNRQTIGQIERGDNTNARANNLLRICYVLGIDIHFSEAETDSGGAGGNHT